MFLWPRELNYEVGVAPLGTHFGAAVKLAWQKLICQADLVPNPYVSVIFAC